MSESAFLASCGAAQAVPGPPFSFAAYLGAVSSVPPIVVVAMCAVLGEIT